MSVFAVSPRLRLLCSCMLVLLLPLSVAAASTGLVAGYPQEQALRLGEQLYQKGLLPSGAPVKAIVQGDIELTGEMTTCANCHLRSGLGSIEGGVLTPPTNGVKLYAPLVSSHDIPGSQMKRSAFKTPRPAYTDDSLRDALINGSGPAGTRLSETMPRYHLDDAAAALLVNYLKQLTSSLSPGVSGDDIRFATIVGKGIAPADRNSLVLPLQAYLREEWNLKMREQRPQGFGSIPATASQAPRPYRKAVLDVWELEGPPESWGRQLEDYHARQPVFAILGGLVSGPWAPVHHFSEKNKIPCIFPDTDLPVISESDWYTLYLSKGLYQEGETAAKYLSRVLELPPGKKIVQVYRSTAEGTALAKGFGDTWKKLGSSPLNQRIVKASEKTGPAFWKGLAKRYPNAVLLAWLPAADLAGSESLTLNGRNKPVMMVSAGLLAGAYASIPDPLRGFTYMTFPTRLPGDDTYARSLVTGWSTFKKIPVTNLRIAANTFSITNLLSRVLIEMGNDSYRDFFLDIWDGGKDESNASLNYPLLSFGPGQRYASKGCYVVTLSAGPDPRVIRQSDWILY